MTTLSHMPFKNSDALYFCACERAVDTLIPIPENVKFLGISAQRITYLPWTLAKESNGVITPLCVEGLHPSNPVFVFCNPVVFNEDVSFIFGRSLYVGTLSENKIKDVKKVKDGVFSGFVQGTKTVFVENSELRESSTFSVIVSGERTDIHVPLNIIVRVIPHEQHYIITGYRQGKVCSILYKTKNDIKRITSKGKDIYKCCIHGEVLFHTLRNFDTGERKVVSGPFELTNLV